MAKKKSFFKRTFGERFGYFDLIMVIIIIGYPIYVIVQSGFEQFLKDFVSYMWIAIVGGYSVTILRRKARK